MDGAGCGLGEPQQGHSRAGVAAWFGMLCQVTCPKFRTWKDSRAWHCHCNATAAQVWEVTVPLRSPQSREQGLDLI